MIKHTAHLPHDTIAHQPKPRRRCRSHTSRVKFLAYSLDSRSSILGDDVADLRAYEGDVFCDVAAADTRLLEGLMGRDLAGVALAGGLLKGASAG
jgi:hypothetical protein